MFSAKISSVASGFVLETTMAQYGTSPLRISTTWPSGTGLLLLPKTGSGVGVGVGSGVFVGVGSGVLVGVGTGVLVEVGTGVAVGSGVEVGMGIAVGISVGVVVAVGSGAGSETISGAGTTFGTGVPTIWAVGFGVVRVGLLTLGVATVDSAQASAPNKTKKNESTGKKCLNTEGPPCRHRVGTATVTTPYKDPSRGHRCPTSKPSKGLCGTTGYIGLSRLLLQGGLYSHKGKMQRRPHGAPFFGHGKFSPLPKGQGPG